MGTNSSLDGSRYGESLSQYQTGVSFRHGALRRVLLPLSLVFLFAGCSQSGAELGSVRGEVTLNGQPLANAMVEFQPAEGATSYGITASDGSYKLNYTRDRSGARLGRHIVRIVTVFSFDDIHANKERQEQIPERYNRKSELTAEVERGRNVFDFHLASE